MKSAGESKISRHELNVKNWANWLLEGSLARPPHCPRCDVAAGQPGRLRLHGHGRRVRTVFGPATVLGAPEAYDVVVRRFRCVECRHVCTVRPPALAPRVLYSLAAVALSMYLWAIAGWSQPEVRAAISPWRRWGASDPKRWRSLRRWALWATRLFDVEVDLRAATCSRAVAYRVAMLLLGRAPPELVDERVRVFAGGHVGRS